MAKNVSKNIKDAEVIESTTTEEQVNTTTDTQDVPTDEATTNKPVVQPNGKLFKKLELKAVEARPVVLGVLKTVAKTALLLGVGFVAGKMTSKSSVDNDVEDDYETVDLIDGDFTVEGDE